MKSFLTALAFLTVIPIPFREPQSVATVARSRFWFPVVGLLLGLILGGWMELTIQLGMPMVSAFVVLLAWVGLTGALHVDGLCDFCDGVLGGHTVEDRLRIMKDPHVGTFGLVGGVLLVLGKFVGLAVVAERQELGEAFKTICAAVFVSRCLVLVMAAGARYPRPEGTGKVLIEATGWREAFVCALMAAVATCLAFPRPFHDLVIFFPVFWAVIVFRRISERRLGGVTGDGLGAAIEITEVVFLLAVAIDFKLAAINGL
jgi:adenosylcobinamide-GDP ribazoletransferase